ncbi:hypothetical protein F5Y00DRAFT_266200 [Daldinia vernicosa]|uniref:uncharacterized protein n=1 Tax=Daldinia vernicosa TaxID=114800 RepID=UPI0020073751|nr:uncharacterized protein F5Y00DRAFT_266200 [Daldinia vernicosa]KAI0844778.1 hypothetical protein F5Y00DRAFT_266200 [Daldinia vernicosa]
MYFTSILIGLAALVAITTGGPLPRFDPYVGDLRTFGQTGCFADNQGVGTVTQSMTGVCNRYGDPFRSMYLYMIAGWVFRAHSDPLCKDEGTVIVTSISGSPFVCNNATNAWVAYQVDRLSPGV